MTEIWRSDVRECYGAADASLREVSTWGEFVSFRARLHFAIRSARIAIANRIFALGYRVAGTKF